MPWTLYRYILKDILKLLIISTSVLVTVISFAAAIKPLTEGLLNAEGLITFIAATAPTMLVYALPFSAAFAVTLTFSRLTGDNEITACSASGLSYAKILLPVGALGMFLMLFLFIMGNWVLPVFNRVAFDLVQKDVMRMMVHQLRKGEAVVLQNYKIYANQADEAPPPVIEGSKVQPDQYILLRGVAVGRMDPKTLATRSDHTAEAADVLVFRDGGRTWVQMRLTNALYHDEATGTLQDSTAMGAESAQMLPNIELPSRFRREPRTMTWAQLVELSHDPELHPRVQADRRTLTEAMAERMLLYRIQQALAPRGAQSRVVRLKGARDGEFYDVTSAAPLKYDANAVIVQATAQRTLLVEHRLNGRLVRYEGRGEARFVAAPLQAEGEPAIVLDMKDLRIIDPRSPDRATELSERRLPRMWWETPIAAPLADTSAPDLLAMAQREEFKFDLAVMKSALYLDATISKLINRVAGEFHERAANAFTCLLATVLGAVLSLRLRGRLPLVVYFWTFLSVIGVLLVLQFGTRLAGDPDYPRWIGTIVIWTGAIALAGAIGGLYAKVSRN